MCTLTHGLHACGLLLSFALALEVQAAQAQVLAFERVRVPQNMSMRALYLFFVYDYNETPDASKGDPFVSFEGFEAFAMRSARRSNASLRQYNGLQLTLMPYADFLGIDRGRMCSTARDVRAGRSAEQHQLLLPNKSLGSEADHRPALALDWYQHMIPFGKHNQLQPEKQIMPINKTNVYALVFSNCGSFDDALIVGRVAVQNAYGFLPGNEYPKMPFYGWLILGYGFLLIVWSIRVMRWWTQIFRIQSCITVVVAMGLLEALLWDVFYHRWNRGGMPDKLGQVMFGTATFFTVMKCSLSYVLVLAASLGWGITQPTLERCTVIKIGLICLLYIIFGYLRELALALRHRYSISVNMLLVCVATVSFLNVLIFCWVFRALGSMIETLRETQQTEKFRLFLRFFSILIAALVVAAVAFFLEVYNLSRSILDVWKYQWILTEGVSHLLFLFVLGSMIYLWAPSENSQRYAFSQQLDSAECDVLSPIDSPKMTPRADSSAFREARGQAASSGTPHPTILGFADADNGDDSV